MKGARHPQHRPVAADDEDQDGVAGLATALGAYLGELSGYADTCRRHQDAAVTGDPSGAIVLTRTYTWAESAVAHVRDAAGGLPGGELPPFRGPDAKSRAGAARARASGHLVFTRGVEWEGSPCLVRVVSLCGRRFLVVALLLPAVPGALPELPLRRVARGLSCHEHLLPLDVAPPLPRGSGPPRPGESVCEFLARVTPPGLFAGKCYSAPGAGN